MAQFQTTHGTNLPPKRGRPMKRKPGVPSPALGAAVHTIHEDGTYSNDFSTKTVAKKGVDFKAIKRDDVMVFGKTFPVSSGVVHKVVDKGIYCRPRKDELPDMSHCVFYSWDEIKALCTEVV